MKQIRQVFYLFIGFTFPGFWMLHASGLYSGLYQPLQHLFHTEKSGWPSFLTASLGYLVIIACFEAIYQLIKRAHP